MATSCASLAGSAAAGDVLAAACQPLTHFSPVLSRRASNNTRHTLSSVYRAGYWRTLYRADIQHRFKRAYRIRAVAVAPATTNREDITNAYYLPLQLQLLRWWNDMSR